MGRRVSKDYPVLVVDGENSTTALADIVQVGGGKDFSCALTGRWRCSLLGRRNLIGRLGNNETLQVLKIIPFPVLDSAGATASAISGISKISA